MSRDTQPPHALQAAHANDSVAVDAGWSTAPPAPVRAVDAVTNTRSAPQAEVVAPGGAEAVSPTAIDQAAGSNEQSGLQRLAKRRRAEGTLLGVAPPQPSAPSLSKARSPVVVHSGVARPEAALVAVSPRPSTEQVQPIAPETAEAAHSDPPAAGASPWQPEHHPFPSQTPSVVAEPAALAEAPQPQVAPPGLGEALSSRVRFAGADRALWRVLTMIVALPAAGVAAALLLAWGARAAQPAERPAAPVTASSATQPASSPAAQAPRADLAAIQAKAPDARSAEEVLTLATVASESERRAARLFREKLARDASAWRDKAALAQLRKLVAEPATYQEALAAIAELPGPIGADLLYEVWTATPTRTDATELARALLHSRDVRAKASDALSVALELRLAETCAATSKLLPQAQAVGDRRAVSPLSKLQRRQGCGPNKKQDCYPCLRDGGELEAALTASKARRAPSPFTPP